MAAGGGLQALYQDVILDHWRNPRGRGELVSPDASVHLYNPTCGDEITVDVVLGGERGETLTAVAHRGHGCSISQGSASVFAELALDHSITEIADLRAAFVEQLQSKGAPGDPEVLGDGVAFAGVGQFPARVRCALLPWTAAEQAIDHAQLTKNHARAIRPGSAEDIDQSKGIRP